MSRVATKEECGQLAIEALLAFYHHVPSGANAWFQRWAPERKPDGAVHSSVEESIILGSALDILKVNRDKLDLSEFDRLRLQAYNKTMSATGNLGKYPMKHPQALDNFPWDP